MIKPASGNHLRFLEIFALFIVFILVISLFQHFIGSVGFFNGTKRERMKNGRIEKKKQNKRNQNISKKELKERRK